jgi:hypothetical protein
MVKEKRISSHRLNDWLVEAIFSLIILSLFLVKEVEVILYGM